MNRKANLFTRLLGVVALALATSVSADNGSEGGKGEGKSSSISPANQTIVTTVNQAISTQPLNASKLGGSVTYSISSQLPAHLSLNSTTGVLSGSLTSAFPKTVFVVTATSGSRTATARITLTVLSSGNNQGTSTSTSTSTTASALNCPDPKDAATETAAIQGRRAYLRLNCYGCHSDYGQGGTMGPNIQGAGGDVAEAVNGDGGMPSFTSALCPNDVTNLQAYLGTVKALSASSAPQLLDWKTYPGNKFTTVPAGVAHFH